MNPARICDTRFIIEPTSSKGASLSLSLSLSLSSVRSEMLADASQSRGGDEPVALESREKEKGGRKGGEE